jgi:hypothetical protein
MGRDLLLSAPTAARRRCSRFDRNPAALSIAENAFRPDGIPPDLIARRLQTVVRR